MKHARGSSVCLSCLLWISAPVAAIAASFWYLAVDFSGLWSARAIHSMASFVSEFLTPDLSARFLNKVLAATLQTFAVSAVATCAAAVAALMLSLCAAGRLGVAMQALSRTLFNFLRSVPELVWAALMVMAVGLGPFAGVMALAMHTTGVLGRLFGETLENASAIPEQTILASGGTPAPAFLYGTLPLVGPQLLAYTLYRWEMNIRMATVLGFVGAGGLGQLLYFSLSIFQQSRASTVLIAMFVLVLIVDALSNYFRHRLVTN